MTTLVLRFCLLFIVALPLAGQTADWKKYDNKEGNFTLCFRPSPQTASTRAMRQ
jgi:hypothetical protein